MTSLEQCALRWPCVILKVIPATETESLSIWYCAKFFSLFDSRVIFIFLVLTTKPLSETPTKLLL